MKYSNSKAIIYRIYNAQSNDKIFHAIASDGAKIIVLAKSIRSKTGRRAGSIEIGNYVNLKLVEGYSTPILSEVKVIDEFLEWKKNFENIMVLQYILEIVDKVAYEGVKDQELFNLLLEILTNSNNNFRFASSIFTLKILENSGHFPDLSLYTDTNQDVNIDKLFVSEEEIGIFSDKNHSRQELTSRLFKSIKFFTLNSLTYSLRINLEKDEIEKLLEILIKWFELATEKEVKSKKMLFSVK